MEKRLAVVILSVLSILLVAVMVGYFWESGKYRTELDRAILEVKEKK